MPALPPELAAFFITTRDPKATGPMTKNSHPLKSPPPGPSEPTRLSFAAMATLVATVLGILGSLALAYYQVYAPQRLAIQAIRTAEASPTPVPAPATNTLIRCQVPAPNTPTPTSPTATATPALITVEIAEGRSIPTTPVFGEIGVKYPITMRAGSSEMVAASIYRVPRAASNQPTYVTDAPLSQPPTKSDFALHLSTIFISEWMRVELEPAPDTFEIEPLGPPSQQVNIGFDYESTYWMWVINAPDAPGIFGLAVRAYLEQETEPVWVGGIQVRVYPD
jgi:hypothetical protein